MRIGRRAALSGLGAAALAHAARFRSAWAQEGEDSALDTRVLRVGGATGTGAAEHDVLLALPRFAGDPARAVPLVVLLHGLGETVDERLGARAWIDRYGLATAAARVTRAPLARVSSRERDDWGDAGLTEVNGALAAHPYGGLAFVCPFVPRLREAQIDAYARWLTEAVVPRVRSEAGARIDGSAPRIAGCSFGAWVSLEAFLRAPDRFGAWAGVQTAIGRAAAPSYAERLARVARGRSLFLETSTRDPFHDATVALAEELRARNVPRDLVVLPGPHDQPWLRESGTPRLLAWLSGT